MNVYSDSLTKFRNLMKAKGHRKVVEEFSEFKDNSGVFIPDIIADVHHTPTSSVYTDSSSCSSSSCSYDGGSCGGGISWI